MAPPPWLLRTPLRSTSPPREPEWERQAVSSVKASDDHLRRMRTERVGGVPARDERLWGMLQAPREGWGGARCASSASWSQASSGPLPPPTIASLSSREGGGDEPASQNLVLRRDSKRASTGGFVSDIGVVKAAR